MIKSSREKYDQLFVYDFEYDSDHSHELRFDSINEVEEICSQSEIRFETRNGKVCIERADLPFSFFKNETQFLHEVQESHFRKLIVISNYDNSNDIIFFESGNNDVIHDFLVPNALAYVESKELFKDIYESADDTFEFVDFYSESNRSISFISISEKKKLKLEMKRVGTVILDKNIDFGIALSLFKDAVNREDRNFRLFLKNSLISNLINESGDKYQAFFNNLEKVIIEANLNYDVYLHELSLDSIKNGYTDYKQKFLESQNSILSKLTTHVFALPISIAAVAFSMSKLSDEIIPLIAIFCGLMGLLSYSSLMIWVYKNDIISLDKQSRKEFMYLSNHDFFMNNPDELTFFSGLRSELEKRLNLLLVSLKVYSAILWTLTLLLFFYWLQLMKGELDWISLAVIIGGWITTYLCVFSSILLFSIKEE